MGLHAKKLASYSMRESFVGSLNESISIEKTVNKEDMKSFMPSQKMAFLRKKSQDDCD